MTAPRTEHVSGTNVSILVLEFAEGMQLVASFAMPQHALAFLDILVTLASFATGLVTESIINYEVSDLIIITL